MSGTHPLLSRAHLEALVVARTVLDPMFADRLELARLSPAALKLVLAAVNDPSTAGTAGVLAVAYPSGRRDDDAFVVRLAERVEQLQLLELTFYPAWLLASLVNQLPQLHADAAGVQQSYEFAIGLRDWLEEIRETRRARRTA